MTTKQITLLGAVLVALDIAKARNEVLIEFPDRQRRRKLSIHNTRDDHDRLIGWPIPARQWSVGSRPLATIIGLSPGD